MFSKQLLAQKSYVTQTNQDTHIDLTISRGFTVYSNTQLLHQLSKREKEGVTAHWKDLIV